MLRDVLRNAFAVSWTCMRRSNTESTIGFNVVCFYVLLTCS